jgi:hypothetical protein
MATASNDLIARSLGPDAYDPPVMPCEPHPFLGMYDFLYTPAIHEALTSRRPVNPHPAVCLSPVCARCGGGLLHAVHALDAQEAA